MEYTTEQVKSIFTLIRDTSLYAYPLLLSLLFPLVWVTLKRLLGLYDKKEEATTALPKTWMQKVIVKIKLWIKIQGVRADRHVFVLSVFLFVVGGVLLKLGEYNEEKIRQRALALKTLYRSENVISLPLSTIINNHFDEDEVETICSRFPNEFILLPAISEKDRTLRCVDPAFYRDYKARAFPLLAAFLDNHFRYTNYIELNNVWSSSNKVKGFFVYDVIYDFLGDPQNKGKYSINAYTNVMRDKDGKDSIVNGVFINKINTNSVSDTTSVAAAIGH